MPLDQVRETIKKSIERFFPVITKEVKGMEFYRFHPRAIAAWPVGRSRFDELSQEIRRPEHRIYFAGDFTESSHSDGAFKSATRVVGQILEENKKNHTKLTLQLLFFYQMLMADLQAKLARMIF